MFREASLLNEAGTILVGGSDNMAKPLLPKQMTKARYKMSSW